GAVRFMTYREAMTAALFITFLGQLLRGAKRKIFLIVDRLKAHEAEGVKEGGAARRGRIELVYLARRAPGVEPGECMNNEVKGSVNGEGLPHNKGELQARLEGFMHKLAQLPDHVKSYFQHPCTQYAAAMDL